MYAVLASLDKTGEIVNAQPNWQNKDQVTDKTKIQEMIM